MFLLAIDIGSTSIKAVVFDCSGNIISSASRKTQVFYQQERDKRVAYWMPDNIWASVCSSIKEAIKNIKNKKKIISVTVTGFACDGVPIDEKGQWIYPFISWHDSRTLSQLEWARENIDFEKIYKINGQKPWTHSTILRNLWFKENMPQEYQKIYKWLLIEDYVNFKLCGKIATDYSLASTTLVFDQKKMDWSQELFDDFGIEKDIYPKPMQSGTILSNISSFACKETGLTQETMVVLGGLDGLLGVYAVSGSQSDALVGIIGTYEHYHKCIKRPLLKKEGLKSSIICQAHVIKDAYDVYGVTVSAGILEWFKDVFCTEESKEAKENNKKIWSILIKKALSSCPGANGIFMLPDVFGSAAPVQDHYSRGVFLGMSPKNVKEDFIRAVFEGLNYKSLELYSAIRNYTKDSSEKIIVTGGGTRNEFWMQNKADIFGKVIEVPEIEEATALGAAMLGGIGVGVYKDFEEAYNKVRKKSKQFLPDEKNYKKYQDFYENVYKNIYSGCRELNKYIAMNIQ